MECGVGAWHVPASARGVSVNGRGAERRAPHLLMSHTGLVTVSTCQTFSKMLSVRAGMLKLCVGRRARRGAPRSQQHVPAATSSGHVITGFSKTVSLARTDASKHHQRAQAGCQACPEAVGTARMQLGAREQLFGVMIFADVCHVVRKL